MKIAVPVNNNQGLASEIAEHFGRCSNYLFLNEQGEIIEIIDNSSEHHGGQGTPPELIKKYGAEILLCRGIGIKAIELCNQLGIQVYAYPAKEVKEIFNLWRNNKLKLAGAENAC